MFRFLLATVWRLVHFTETGSASGGTDWRNSGGREWHVLSRVCGDGDPCGNPAGCLEKKALCEDWNTGEAWCTTSEENTYN